MPCGHLPSFVTIRHIFDVRFSVNSSSEVAASHPAETAETLPTWGFVSQRGPRLSLPPLPFLVPFAFPFSRGGVRPFFLLGQ